MTHLTRSGAEDTVEHWQMAITHPAEGLAGNGATMPEAAEAAAEVAAEPEAAPERAAARKRRARKDGVVTAAARAGDAVAIAVAEAPSPTPDRIDAIAAAILGAPAGTPKEIQSELARSARLLPRLRLSGNNDLVDEIAIAVRAALVDPPNLDLARKANAGVAGDLRFRSYTPATRMLVGVAILSYFFAFGWLLAGGQILGLEIRNLIGPAIFGWLGSVASMVTRINKFRHVPNPLTVGATRPVLGSAFGIFTYLALTSGIVNLGTTLEPTAYFAIAFIAGFSERFVPDLISQFESDNVNDSATEGVAVATATAGETDGDR
jgi:hypothetical protein